MKKYISIILITTVLFNISGYYLLFNVLQHNIQKEIKQKIRKGLKDDDLSLIIVSIKDESGICWIEPNKEFRYDGEMYDVVKIKIQNQKKYYYCIKDTDEKQLIANYNKNHNTKKEIESIIKKVFDSQFFLQQFIISNNIYHSDFGYATITFRYISHSPKILSPPPKVA